MYPLTPVPLSMCNPDEAMVKTDKSSLLNLLETKQEKTNSIPRQIGCYVIDGQYLLHTLPPNLPASYGGLARSILIQALSMSKMRVHIAFDDYSEPSLKGAERLRRGTTEEEKRSYVITGPAQRRLKDLSKALQSRAFKRELPSFLAREWEDASYSSLIGTCEVFLDVPSGDCYHLCFGRW